MNLHHPSNTPSGKLFQGPCWNNKPYLSHSSLSSIRAQTPSRGSGVESEDFVDIRAERINNSRSWCYCCPSNAFFVLGHEPKRCLFVVAAGKTRTVHKNQVNLTVAAQVLYASAFLRGHIRVGKSGEERHNIVLKTEHVKSCSARLPVEAKKKNFDNNQSRPPPCSVATLTGTTVCSLRVFFTFL